MIKRLLLNKIVSQLKNEVLPRGVILYGARQVGKTTLVKEILRKTEWKFLETNGDHESESRNILISRDVRKIKALLSGYEGVFIDEAQRIPEIGLSAKIILDEMPEMKVILTGSAALDLASKISEPLTGRAYSYCLWPVSQGEMVSETTYAERLSQLEDRLVYGSYPKIFSIENSTERSVYLHNLIDKYLYKDMLELEGVRSPHKVRELLRLLAYQVGSQVSILELATQMSISRREVDKYIDLLEKSFVIFRLQGFSRNLRKEMSKMNKIYFYDTGIRNALIGDFQWLGNRQDVGKIWENWLITERIKRNEYLQNGALHYFWRLSSGAELDFVEDLGGELFGYEFKWKKKKARVPNSWLEGYKESSFKLVNFDNWQEFVIADLK